MEIPVPEDLPSRANSEDRLPQTEFTEITLSESTQNRRDEFGTKQDESKEYEALIDCPNKDPPTDNCCESGIANSSIDNNTEFIMDVNFNFELTPTPKLSKVSATVNLDYLMRPDPVHGFPASGRSNVTIFNIFHDIGRYFYQLFHPKPKKVDVHFPDDVVETAEIRGETAGKDREVAKMVDYKRPKQWRNKSTTLLTSTSSQEFSPYITTMKNSSALETWCEKIDCCKPKRTKNVNYIRTNEDFMFFIATANRYIHIQLSGISPVLEVVDLPNSLMVETSRSNKSVSEEMTHTQISTARIGLLSIRIWIFAYCLQFLFTGSQNPTKSTFQMLLQQYFTFVQDAEDKTQTLLASFNNFQKFIREAKRVFEIIRSRYGLEQNVKQKKDKPFNPKRGEGLVMKPRLSTRKLTRTPKVIVSVSERRDYGEDPVWKSFADVSPRKKLDSLNHLLSTSSNDHERAVNEIQLLVDEIVEASKNQTDYEDYLNILANLSDRIQTVYDADDSEEKVKAMVLMASEFGNLESIFENFKTTTEHVTRRLIEYRDTMQLSLHYIQYQLRVMGIETTGLAPPSPADDSNHDEIMSDIFNPWGKHKNKGCFRTGACQKRKSVFLDKQSLNLPNYSPLEFFRIYYEDSFDLDIASSIFWLQIRESSEQNILPPRGTSVKYGLSDSDLVGSPVHVHFGSIDSVGKLNEEQQLETVASIPVIKSILKSSHYEENAGPSIDPQEAPPLPVHDIDDMDEDKPSERWINLKEL